MTEQTDTNEADDLDLDNLSVKDAVETPPPSDTLLWFSEVSEASNGKYEALGPFVNADTKTRILHSQCGYEYDATPYEWRQGRRCWRCNTDDIHPMEDEWRKEIDADIDRYTALGRTELPRDRRLIRHDACLNEFFLSPRKWRDGKRCYKCPPIHGRMYKTREWRKEVCDSTDGEYRAISDYIRPDREVRVIHLVCGFEWGVRPGNWRARTSRCPQCAESTGDNDAVYIWRKQDRYIDGRIIVKVGTTSWRLGNNRINRVATLHKTEANVLIFERVAPGTASDVEATVLLIGEPLDYSNRIDGSTEFRIVNDEELNRMVTIMTSARLN